MADLKEAVELAEALDALDSAARGDSYYEISPETARILLSYIKDLQDLRNPNA